MNNARKIFIYSLLFAYMPSQNYIYRIDILKPTTKESPLILCLSDFHDKTHPETGPQQVYLDKLLDQLAEKNTFVIVEDLSSPNTKTGLTGCGNYSIDSRGGILGGLSTTCKQKNIPVENVEYRFCRVAAFGPILNNLSKSPNSLDSANKINIGTIYREIKRAIERIQTFQDGSAIQKYYNQNINQVLNELTRLQVQGTSQLSIAEYLQKNSTPQMRLETLKKLLTFDSGLLDTSFVHAVLQSHDKDIILIVAGGAHINNVCELLEKNGYRRIYNTPVGYFQERNLDGCIGSRIIDENYCVKPKATDLRALDKFIE
jgi:rhodanese-related sulfurtransferase